MGNLAQSYLAVGRHADALRLNEETLALRRSTLGPDHPNTLWSMNNLAETYFKMGRYAEALQRGKETLALRQVKLGPDHRETLMSMQIVADSYAQLGQGADAIKHYELLLSQWEKKLGADHREIADRCIRLAWCLAFSPDDAQTHDPRRAVALAERGVKLAPEEGGYWRTLGVAHYRAGDWQAAVTALDKAISLDKGEDDWLCLNWTFLAMAHWQMGDKDEARKYYDQATKWIEKRNTGDIVLRHFQDEAAELLGIKDGIRK
jgi:tetratricopeptide (TPR) repeat protein